MKYPRKTTKKKNGTVNETVDEKSDSVPSAELEVDKVLGTAGATKGFRVGGIDVRWRNRRRGSFKRPADRRGVHIRSAS